jgi:hypothetical protein
VLVFISYSNVVVNKTRVYSFDTCSIIVQKIFPRLSIEVVLFIMCFFYL